ncbi:MAG: toprim domain-containing protein, partial [Limisphaerales bacterium]
GQLDLISCFMAGVQNIVAPQGTAFTSEHARIIKRYANEVVLCFDSDEAGQKATVRVLDDLLGSGLAIRVATIPAPHDPDTFIKEFGAAGFEELLKKAEGFFDYYLNRLCAKNDIRSDKGQQTVLTSMAEAVQKTGDPTLVDRYAQKTAGRLGMNALSALERFKSALAKPAPRPDADPTQGEPAEPAQRPNPQEFWLLKIILHHDEMIEPFRKFCRVEWIRHPDVREILDRRLELDVSGNPVQPAAFLRLLTSDHAQSLVTEALAESRSIPNPEAQLADIATKLRNASIDEELKLISQSIVQPGISEEHLKELLREQMELKKARRRPILVEPPLGAPAT